MARATCSWTKVVKQPLQKAALCRGNPITARGTGRALGAIHGSRFGSQSSGFSKREKPVDDRSRAGRLRIVELCPAGNHRPDFNLVGVGKHFIFRHEFIARMTKCASMTRLSSRSSSLVRLGP